MKNLLKLSIRNKYDRSIDFFTSLRLKKFKKKFYKDLNSLSLNVIYFDIYFLRFYRDKYDHLIKLKIKKNSNYLKLLVPKINLFIKLCLFCLNSLWNSILIIILSKKNNIYKSSLNTSILLDCFYGCSNLKKNDLPFYDQEINKEKIIYLIRNKTIYENCKLDKDFSVNRAVFLFNKNSKILNLKNKIPLNINYYQSANVIKLIFKWLKNPLLISIVMKFYIDYLTYLSIINFYNIDIYVDPKPGADQDSLVLSYAIDKKKGESVCFQRSFISKKEHGSYLYGCSTLICWSKEIYQKIHKTNNINKYIFYRPPFGIEKLDKKYISNLRDKIQKRQVITVFDTSFSSGISLFSKDTYNHALEFILKTARDKKNIFLILKLKNHLNLKNLYKENENLINQLLNQNSLIIVDETYKSNNEIIFVSDLVCSFNSMTIFSEAIYQEKKNLVFNNLSLGNQLIQNVDKLDKGACVNNFDDFKKYFLIKIQNKNKDIDFSSIKKLLFTTENNITDTLINKYFIKQ